MATPADIIMQGKELEFREAEWKAQLAAQMQQTMLNAAFSQLGDFQQRGFEGKQQEKRLAAQEKGQQKQIEAGQATETRREEAASKEGALGREAAMTRLKMEMASRAGLEGQRQGGQTGRLEQQLAARREEAELSRKFRGKYMDANLESQAKVTDARVENMRGRLDLDKEKLAWDKEAFTEADKSAWEKIVQGNKARYALTMAQTQQQHKNRMEYLERQMEGADDQQKAKLQGDMDAMEKRYELERDLQTGLARTRSDLEIAGYEKTGFKDRQMKDALNLLSTYEKMRESGGDVTMFEKTNADGVSFIDEVLGQVRGRWMATATPENSMQREATIQELESRLNAARAADRAKQAR